MYTDNITLYNGVQYHGGFSTVADIMMQVGDLLSTMAVLSTVEDIMINVGIS